MNSPKHLLSSLYAMTLLVSLAQFSPAQENREPVAPGSVVVKLAEDVERVNAQVAGNWTCSWINRVRELPTVKPRTIKLGERELSVDEDFFYSGRYGSPLAYCRLLDLAESAGFAGRANSKILDFGYGSIGHLRMLALAGMDVVGVDVAPLLPMMYADEQGSLGAGSVKLLHGKFPSEQRLVEAVGKEFDLVISKNTLKRGYIHPAREVDDKRKLIDLGVDDATFLAAMFHGLKPGGLLVIYNFCPAQAAESEPYIPWADGQSPFTREQYAAAGFEVLSFDVVDDSKARAIGKALNWDEQGMKLNSDLFAWYTIVRK